MPPSLDARASSACALALAALVAAGCNNQRGLPPPDLREEVGQATAQTQRMEAIQEVMRRDLGRVVSLREAFFAVPPEAYQPPFPLATFRHAAMSCLNEPFSLEPPEALPPPGPEVRAAEALGVRCTPSSLPSLYEALEALERPRHLARARAQLGRVDQVRELRAKIEERAGRIDLLTDAARARLARMRAQRRKRLEQAQQRRPDYTRERWAETQRRMERLADQLDELERAIEAIEQDAPAWRPTLSEQLHAFTYELAWLGLEAPASSPGSSSTM